MASFDDTYSFDASSALEENSWMANLYHGFSTSDGPLFRSPQSPMALSDNMCLTSTDTDNSDTSHNVTHSLPVCGAEAPPMSFVTLGEVLSITASPASADPCRYQSVRVTNDDIGVKNRPRAYEHSRPSKQKEKQK
ncbi:hypothetical protein N7541_000254 [Penicillium brevicompactum]|uniref:Uncharacterized protein n=1 Tax=Penicillium brevicompactum TaxID=5074 RepID=A0A9W9RYN8_PENBR|nr:hypothetical protein N7541_000254 [Penicillium brevicompactum]